MRVRTEVTGAGDDKAEPDGQCLTLTNVCPCGSEYADKSKDDGKEACCEAG